MSCEQCEKVQFEANDIRDCSICLKPTIMPENIVPFQLYQIVRTQWIIAGMGEPIALNYSTVLDVINLYQVEDPVDCFEKIITLSMLDLREMDKKRTKDGGK